MKSPIKSTIYTAFLFFSEDNFWQFVWIDHC